MSERLTDDFETIERYLDGKLSRKERLEFEERLLVDPKLKTQYDFYAALVEGIRESRKQELLHYIEEHTRDVRERKSFFFGILPFVLTTLLILSTVYFVTENYIPAYRLPRVINKVDSLIKLPFYAIRHGGEEQLKKEFGKTKASAAEPESTPVPADAYTVEEDLTASDNEDYITVKEDELLGDTFVMALPLHVQQTDTATIDSLVQSGWRTVQLEFWQSPVNYSGYRYTGRKLQLYGLAPDAASLISAEEDLYLRYGKQYFYIEKDGNFHTYKPMEAGLVKKLLRH
jgi:hypothetical protein